MSHEPFTVVTDQVPSYFPAWGNEFGVLLRTAEGYYAATPAGQLLGGCGSRFHRPRS